MTRLNAAGSALVWSTYLGSSNYDIGNAIAIDGFGNAFVMGTTFSTNFPTANPLQASNAGGGDVFVTRLNAAGSALVFSTYLGGTGSDNGYGIAVDGAGNAFVTGITNAPNFPTVNPLQPYGGAEDAFVARLRADGSALVFSTYLGGSTADQGFAIAVDGASSASLERASRTALKTSASSRRAGAWRFSSRRTTVLFPISVGPPWLAR